MSSSRVLLIALAVVLTALVSPAQRGVRAVTASGSSHTEPKISPNGKWVAFKTSNNGVTALGIVHVDVGPAERFLFTGKTLTQFFWHPDSRGLFYQSGASIRYISTLGGTPLAVGTISGNSPTLHGLDPTGTYLVGVSNDTSFNYQIWRLNTDGQTRATTIHRVSFNFIDSVVVDPSGQKIGYTSQPAGNPFAPVDIRRVDVDGKNDISMSGGPIPDILRLIELRQPKNLAWADDGKTLLFTAADLLVAPWQIYRVSETDHDPMLMSGTDFFHTEPSVQGDWLLYRGTIRHQTATPHDHWVPGVMPLGGGGRVPLEPESDWVMTGAPSMDALQRRVVFAGYAVGSLPGARPEVQLVELDREVRVYPRATIGSALNFELPVASGESGTLFLSPDLLTLDASSQVSIPGLLYRVAINPSVLLPVLSGVGNGTGPLKLRAVIPLDQALIGIQVYLQGLRLKSAGPVNGDLTRFVQLRIFDYRL